MNGTYSEGDWLEASTATEAMAAATTPFRIYKVPASVIFYPLRLGKTFLLQQRFLGGGHYEIIITEPVVFL